MSKHRSPSQYRREGRNAFYPGGVAEDECRYAAGGGLVPSMKRDSWLKGWREAEDAHQHELERPPSLEERVTRLEEIVAVMVKGRL